MSLERDTSAPMPGWVRPIGVRIAGTGSAVPDKVVTNTDLMQVMDTSDEWITQRTGIERRRLVDRSKGENTTTLAITAAQRAVENASLDGTDIDLVLVSSMTQETNCPPTACVVADAIGSANAGGWDINGACCGFVFGLGAAYSLVQAGMARNLLLVGADTLSRHIRYNTAGRATSVLFGDAAGAIVLSATDDASLGLVASSMHSDGGRWPELYIPMDESQFPEGVTPSQDAIGQVQMNGKAVFRFAVGTFQRVITETLEKAGITTDQVDMFVCHQSNARIIEAARERFGIKTERIYVNIDRYGNTVAASIPLCLDELRRSGRVHDGQRVMFVAFGAGLTWGANLWQL